MEVDILKMRKSKGIFDDSDSEGEAGIGQSTIEKSTSPSKEQSVKKKRESDSILLESAKRVKL